MATRAIAPQQKQKLSRSEAASQMAALVETHMTTCGFSESDKNKRVKQFSDRVEKATRHCSK